VGEGAENYTMHIYLKKKNREEEQEFQTSTRQKERTVPKTHRRGNWGVFVGLLVNLHWGDFRLNKAKNSGNRQGTGLRHGAIRIHLGHTDE